MEYEHVERRGWLQHLSRNGFRRALYTNQFRLDAAPYDTDNSVVGGQTYYYVVTAVDSSGAESGYSNQTQAVVPSP